MLMAGLWLWVIAEAALHHAKPHRQTNPQSSAATCSACSVALGLVEVSPSACDPSQAPALMHAPVQPPPTIPQTDRPAPQTDRGPPQPAP